MTRTLAGLTEADVSVDLLSQIDGSEGRRDLQLTVREAELDRALEVCRSVVADLGGRGVDETPNLARVTLVGSGMHKRPGVYARAFEALRKAGVAVYAVSASSVSIILVVDGTAEEDAVRVLHESFGLGEEGE
jgi:aspartate kinase